MARELSNEHLAALDRTGITAAYCVRLDFLNETIFAWSGVGAISIPAGATGDPLLDGNTFDPIVAGPIVSFSANKFSYSGSEPFSISLEISSSVHPEIAASTYLPDEFQSRPATIWQAVMVTPPGAAAGIWVFKRIRSGQMDQVTVTNDGTNKIFELTIEGFASFVANASGSQYLDQKTKFDPADTSQDSAIAIANGSPAPQKAANGGNAFINGVSNAVR
ncbi:MAG: hypothetical protein ABW128_21840 [Rhizorhabdus sp.]